MSEFHPDLDSYFVRIGLDGPRAPTGDFLSRLVSLHQRTIAFENLTSFSGGVVTLDPAAVENKLIRDGRGGYCHEQNSYLRLVLMALGFEVKLRMARVRWMQPPDATPQRGHMMLNVAAEGVWYLCDVAFGAMTPTMPLRLDTEQPQETPHQTYRLVRVADARHLEVKLGDFWRPVYSFDDVDHHPVDFEAANWLVSTHPSSEFVRTLVVARPTPDERRILNNRTLSFRRSDGTVEKKMLLDIGELRSTLTTMFGIALPVDATTTNALQRLFETGTRS